MRPIQPSPSRIVRLRSCSLDRRLSHLASASQSSKSLQKQLPSFPPRALPGFRTTSPSTLSPVSVDFPVLHGYTGSADLNGAQHPLRQLLTVLVTVPYSTPPECRSFLSQSALRHAAFVQDLTSARAFYLSRPPVRSLSRRSGNADHPLRSISSDPRLLPVGVLLPAVVCLSKLATDPRFPSSLSNRALALMTYPPLSFLDARARSRRRYTVHRLVGPSLALLPVPQTFVLKRSMAPSLPQLHVTRAA